MKKILLTLTCALALASCSHSNKNSQGSESERDSLMQVIGQKDEELNDLIGCINEIQEGFQRINEAEGRVTIATGTIENNSSKETIRENISFIQDAMQKNRDMIAQLEQKLKTSSFNVSALEKTIASLQKEMAEKDGRIQEMIATIAEKDSIIFRQGEQIDNLSNNVNALTEENREKSETVASQDKELNKAWFVFGTRAELKEQKILRHDDVLRSSDFNKNYFTEVDIRTMKEIKLYSKKAELLTNHPEGSYKLAKNQKGEYVLTITDPKKFWSVSKFLVVLVR